MPTECERSIASLAVEQEQQHQQLELGAEEELQQQQQIEQQLHPNLNDKMESSINKEEELLNGEMSTSQTSTTSSNGHNNGGIGSSNGSNGIGKKTSITSPDPTAYVAKARVTRPTPPPPSYNPMQFVQIKPCNLYQTAQQQLKKAEEVKKIKEIKKEEPEDWQNNLDNWKSSRRKRVEHIIDRVVEVKKLELEEHDRNRRKSKTFSEMIEERGERPLGRGRTKLVSLAVYNEDESNDLSDLGIGTSSASGKSSQSEDYDNNSVLSDNAELDKAIFENNHKLTNSIAREYISSPGYDTSSSTAPGSSPDPCEYTYEGAIQDYKQRVSRATGGTGAGAAGGPGANYNKNGHNNNNITKASTPERTNRNGGAGGGVTETYPTRRGSKIEDRLIGFEVTSPSDSQEGVEKQKVDVPKIDISKRKEIFENQNANNEPKSVMGNKGVGSGNGVPKVTLRDHFKLDSTASSSSSSSSSNKNSNNNDAQESTSKKEVKRLSGDITSIRGRLQSLEQQQNLVNSTNSAGGGAGGGSGSGVAKLSTAKSVDIAVAPLKDRLSSLQNAVTKEEIKKPPVVLIDARQLEIMKSEEETAKQRKKQKQQQQLEAETQARDATIKSKPSPPPPTTVITALEIIESIEAESEADRDDSGVHTSDDIELNEERHAEFNLQKEQEEQLNAAIAALAMEERQLEEAANAVNQIEAEFAELTTAPAASSSTATTPLVSTTNNNNNNEQQQPCEMEFSVSSTNKSNTSSPYIISSSSGSCNIGNNDNIIGRDNEVATTCKIQNDNQKNAKAAEVSGNFSRNDNQENACNLRRKPSNEMVHARNLLKMFKETFKNDIELDEEPEEAMASTGAKGLPKSTEPKSPGPKVTSPIEIPISPYSSAVGHHSSSMSPITIETQIFQARTPTPPSSTSPYNRANNPHAIPLTPPSPSAKTPLSMIPRSINNPAGKPPMSPKSVRHVHAKLPTESPLSSPTPTRKTDSQFSINGRVEIFNSKNMMSTDNPTATVKPPTPTMTTKKSTATFVVPHLTTPSPPATTHGKPEAQTLSNNANSNIELLRQKQQWQQQHHQQQQQQQSPTALPSVTEALSISNQKILSDAAKSMPAGRSVNEPHVTRLLTNMPATSQLQKQHHQQPQHHQSQTEIVICAPPVTIVNPDELPKPNTVKALSSCFSHDNSSSSSGSKMTPQPPKPLPKPLPRSRIPQTTPPQSPTPAKRNYMSGGNLPPVMSKELQKASTPELLRHTPFDDSTKSQLTINDDDASKKLSVISNTSTISTDSMGRHAGPFETTAVVHSTPNSPCPRPISEKVHTNAVVKKPNVTLAIPITSSDPLKPNDVLTPTITLPSEIPPLLLCAPNESSLYKLASSAPASPVSPRAVTEKVPAVASPSPPPPSDTDIALCTDFFSSFAPTKAFLAAERQQSVNESPCDKIDVTDLPDDKIPSTGFSDINPTKVKQCDAGEKQKLKDFLAERQKHAVDEMPCKRIDVNDLPQPDYLPATGYTAITKDDVKRCDGPYSLNAVQPSSMATPAKTSNSNPNSKPNSPIMEARAAHSKALIETCEKIIAEERHTYNQMKSSLPSSPKTTPQLQRKSKIPKPIPCCIGGSESMSKGDYELAKPTSNKESAQQTSSGASTPNSVNNENLLIARLHVVETAIKVTTTTPPASPKVKETKAPQSQGGKKTKNIFDFLKKNFTHHDETSAAAAATQAAASSADKSASTQNAPSSSSGNPTPPVDVVKIDEIITIDNSKFYIPSDDMPPPPLPLTPAPVNIEITKTITTDELMESNSEKALTQEINDMLDDELNKLSLESGTLSERGDKLAGK